MSDLHLLDIVVRPGAYVKDVVDGCWLNLEEGVRRAGGKNIHGFKIVGENRIIAVIEGAAEGGAQAVTAAFGDHTDLTCTPLRSYEGFAEHVLGADKSRIPPSSHHFGTDGQLFWLHFSIEYRGLSLVELLAIWRAEAETILGLKASGKMEIDLFKVVGQREVDMFVKCPNAEVMDDVIFTLPIMKDVGNQVHITTKSITKLQSRFPQQI